MVQPSMRSTQGDLVVAINKNLLIDAGESRETSPLSVASAVATPEPEGPLVDLTDEKIGVAGARTLPKSTVPQPTPKSPPRKAAVLKNSYEVKDNPKPQISPLVLPGQLGWTQEFCRKVAFIKATTISTLSIPSIPGEKVDISEADYKNIFPESLEVNGHPAPIKDEIFPPHLKTTGFAVPFSQASPVEPLTESSLLDALFLSNKVSTLLQ